MGFWGFGDILSLSSKKSETFDYHHIFFKVDIDIGTKSTTSYHHLTFDELVDARIPCPIGESTSISPMIVPLIINI